MRILLIHNRYQQYGGEDSTYEAEKSILENNHHQVETLIFENSEINSTYAKLKLSYELVYNRKSAWRVDQLIREFRPEIIHVHNLFYMASPAVLFAAHKHKVPVVVTLQNYRLICSGALLMRDSKPCELCINKIFPLAGIRYACHRKSRMQTAHLTFSTGIHKIMKTWTTKVTRYIAVTEFARHKYINSSLDLSPEQVVVKPSSVPQAEVSGFHERENFFLFVGRLVKEKGIETFLKAFKDKGIQVEIIGDGPLKALVEEAAGTSTNIRYLGYREKSFIVSRLRKSLALIVPSNWYECLPNTILEAYSTGTPVIISDIGNLNEIVSDQINGVLFKPNDPEDLYEKARHFSENREGREPLYLNARKTYLDKYTPEKNYENLMRIYSEAIKAGTHP